MSGDDKSTDIVPFGKYKGEPMAALIADQDYRDWLMTQPWFRERFINVYQTIVNYGGQPQETPEHNEMQASFLDDERCFRLAKLLCPDSDPSDRSRMSYMNSSGSGYRTDISPLLEEFRNYISYDYHEPSISGRKFEDAGWDFTYTVASVWAKLAIPVLPPCSCECDHDECPVNGTCQGGDGHCRHKGCEDRQKDQSWSHCTASCPWRSSSKAAWLQEKEHWFQAPSGGRILVELKPDLGDDFPTVLRQVTRYDHHDWQGRRCVIVRRHDFEGVTWEQVVSIFEASQITLLHEADLGEQG